MDSGNQITHYGKLSQAANGAAGFTMPGGMAPGAYTIRLFNEECSGDNYTDFASTPIDISMMVVGTAADASLTVTAPTIASETVGYTQPAAQAITIANNGGVDAVITSVALSGVNANDFEIGGSGGTIPGNGSMNTWTVRPKAGLAAAAYTAQIVVTYANGGTNTTAGDTVSFTVNPMSSSGPGGVTTYTMTYRANGGTGSEHKVSGIAANAKHTVLTASAAGISREGYDFKCWNTKTDGSGTAYAAGSSLTVKQSVTLYAQWEKAPGKGTLEAGSHITYLRGYTDGTVRPDNAITRAEGVKIVNAILERKIDSDALAQVTNPYHDLSKNHWAYADIIEASVIHEYTRNENGAEIWKTW